MFFITDVTKSTEGIIYFFQYKNGEIAALKSVDAIMSHSGLLIDYLVKSITIFIIYDF